VEHWLGWRRNRKTARLGVSKLVRYFQNVDSGWLRESARVRREPDVLCIAHMLCMRNIVLDLLFISAHKNLLRNKVSARIKITAK
jgi:hypothetical protein